MKTITKKTMAKYLTKGERALADNQDIPYVPWHTELREVTEEWYGIERTIYKPFVEHTYPDNKVDGVCKKMAKSVRNKLAKIIASCGVNTAEEAVKTICLRDKEDKRRETAYKKYINKLEAMSHSSVDYEFRCIRTGSNYDGTIFQEGKLNDVTIEEWKDPKGYSRSCKWTMVRRGGIVTIKKGYHIKNIGGLLTFIKGEIDRKGIPCMWAEQGKSISDITMKRGYLVSGEHIEAPTLEQAQEINKRNRRAGLDRILKERTKYQEYIKKLDDVKVTFDMSIASGNCKPGTEAFVNKVEAVLGKKITEMTAKDVMYYGDKFGVSYYAQRAVRYAMSANK